MSAGSTFFDTNVLLYVYGGDPIKQAKAKELFWECARAGSVLLSTQVVQEFYVAASRKLRMRRADARDAISFLLAQRLVMIGREEIVAAVHLEERYNIS